MRQPGRDHSTPQEPDSTAHSVRGTEEQRAGRSVHRRAHTYTQARTHDIHILCMDTVYTCAHAHSNTHVRHGARIGLLGRQHAGKLEPGHAKVGDLGGPCEFDQPVDIRSISGSPVGRSARRPVGRSGRQSVGVSPPTSLSQPARLLIHTPPHTHSLAGYQALPSRSAGLRGWWVYCTVPLLIHC